MTASAEDDDLVYSPTPLLPETFLDLDLMLVTAADDVERGSALVAGTLEVLSRFDHLADVGVFCASSKSVVADMAAAAQRLIDLGHNEIADWLNHQVVDMLVAQQELHERCAGELRAATDLSMPDVCSAASSILAASESLRSKRFAPFPSSGGGSWGHDVKLAVLAAMSAELRRNPLRNQLDGAGGAAGSAEFNPYVHAMFGLELATHRRIYRVLYCLAEQVGVDLSGDELFQSPEVVDCQQF